MLNKVIKWYVGFAAVIWNISGFGFKKGQRLTLHNKQQKQEANGE